MTVNEEGLKWCPFCGSCHTTSYQLYGSRNEAVNAWNTRVKDE